MGRAFEFRKERKMKRWSAMAKAFTRIGREIALAVKQSGPDPANNPRLRTAMQNAKGVQMPKDKIDAAIKRAVSREEKEYEEIVYEGYGPHGIAILIETATDNPVRTVANLRAIFNKNGGSLGTQGSVAYMFDRKGVFTIETNEKTNIEDLEMDLIEAGADDIEIFEDEMIAYCGFLEFAGMTKVLEDKGINVKSAELQRFPNITKEVTAEEEAALTKILDKFDEDDDVQNVFTTMA